MSGEAILVQRAAEGGDTDGLAALNSLAFIDQLTLKIVAVTVSMRIALIALLLCASCLRKPMRR